MKKAAQKMTKATKPFLNEKAIENAIIKAGEKIGERAGSKSAGHFVAKQLLRIPKLVGKGDYEVHANSLVRSGGVTEAMNQPIKFMSNDRGVRIREREFVSAVVGNIAFNNESFTINPSDPRTFPWLSSFADCFDQWEPHGIVFEYRTLSSDYAANTALGLVIMATEYDVSDPNYIDRVEAENSDYAISAKPSCNMMAGIECSPSERPTKILYTGFPGVGRDASLYNLANFQIITQGLPANNLQLGELWVSYDITFYKKQLKGYGKSGDASFIAVNGMTPGSPFGAALIPSYSWNNGIQLAFQGTNTILLPDVSGRFIMTIRLVGVTLTGLTPSPANGVNIVEALTSTLNGGVITYVMTYDVTVSTTATPAISLTITGTSIGETSINVQQVKTGQLFRGS